MNRKLADLMNNQINKEMYSAYLYLGMSDFYQKKGLYGFAHWFKKQALEEFEHATKFMNFLQDLDVSYSLNAIEGVKNNYSNLKEPLIEQLKHEKYVTSLINNLYEVASSTCDHATKLFLEYFVTEQVEEEKNAKELIETFEFLEGDKAGLYNFNLSLGNRK